MTWSRPEPWAMGRVALSSDPLAESSSAKESLRGVGDLASEARYEPAARVKNEPA
jgi:hypothetical protein